MLLTQTWTTKDVEYALKKYVCMLFIRFPKGTCTVEPGCKVPHDDYKVIITTQDTENKYTGPNEHAYATILSTQRGTTFQIPYKQDKYILVGCNENLNREQTAHLLKMATHAAVIPEFSGNKPHDDVKLTLTIGDWDMSAVISKLAAENKVKVRYTEHECRADVRDLKWVQGLGDLWKIWATKRP